MSTVAANTQTTVTLAAGQQMTVKGNGMAFYGPGPLNAQPVTILNVATFGPFADRSQAVTLQAGPSGLTYNVFSGSSVPARATTGSSGASDGGLISPDGDPIIQVPPQPDLATLNATYPAASNLGRTALVAGVPYVCNGVVWAPQASSEIVSDIAVSDMVLFTASSGVKGCGGILQTIRCTNASAIALTLYDNPSAASGRVVYTGTLSTGDEVTVASWFLNGLYASFTGTATFEVEFSEGA